MENDCWFVCYHFGESRDDFAESGQTLVDVGSFLESSAFGAGSVGSLRSGQIDQRYFADLLRRQAGRLIETALGEDQRENGVRPARRFVHVGGRYRPILKNSHPVTSIRRRPINGNQWESMRIKPGFVAFVDELVDVVETRDGQLG